MKSSSALNVMVLSTMLLAMKMPASVEAYDRNRLRRHKTSKSETKKSSKSAYAVAVADDECAAKKSSKKGKGKGSDKNTKKSDKSTKSQSDKSTKSQSDKSKKSPKSSKSEPLVINSTEYAYEAVDAYLCGSDVEKEAIQCLYGPFSDWCFADISLADLFNSPEIQCISDSQLIRMTTTSANADATHKQIKKPTNLP